MADILTKLRNETDMHRRRLLLTGYITNQLKPHNLIPIIVGGQAVELYTFQDYATLDLDLIVANRSFIPNILEPLGFHKALGARHWINDELDLAIEIPDDVLAGDLKRLLEIEIDDFSVYVIGVEDLIIDRLNAYVHWRSVSDYEQALKIYLNHHDQIDHNYLSKQANDNTVHEGLQRLNADFKRFNSRVQ